MLKCPSCGAQAQFDILVEHFDTYDADESFVSPDDSASYFDDSSCRCLICGHLGIVSDYRREAENAEVS